jgi:hypothetical protein
MSNKRDICIIKYPVLFVLYSIKVFSFLNIPLSFRFLFLIDTLKGKRKHNLQVWAKVEGEDKRTLENGGDVSRPKQFIFKQGQKSPGRIS